jgi:hypothetical protein
MTPTAADVSSELPSVAEALGGVLARIPVEHQPLMIALAERMAAERYRSWAAEPSYRADEDALLLCAQREEQIAGRIESLDPDAAGVQRGLLADNPDIVEINRDLFAGRPLDQQLAIQAQGERLGAATWRALARSASGPAIAAFEACALLEEESAVVLETILKRRGTS